jgi:hypothetical protein
MEDSSKNKQQQAVDAASGSKPAAARPHWRRRDPADTAVYVVQPDQFRAVVQQLTGTASSPPPVHRHQGGHGATAAQQHQAAVAGGGTGASTNAAPSQQQQQQHGGGRTLGQIQQECMAWANSDDD